MSCQLTYKGRQYDSVEDLRNFLMKEHREDSLYSADLPLSKISPEAEEIIQEYDMFIEEYERYTSYDKVIDQLRKKVKDIQNQIQSLKSQRREFSKGDSIKNVEIKSKISKLELRLVKAEAQLENALGIKNAESLHALAIKEIDDLQSIYDEIKDLSPREFMNKAAFLLDSLRFWEAVGTIDDLTDHIIMEKEELAIPEVRERLLQIGGKAKEVIAQFNTASQNQLLEEINRNVKGYTITLEDIKNTRDLGFWNNKETFDIGVMGDALLATIQLLEKEQVTRALVAIDRTFKELDSAFAEALPYFNNNMASLTDTFIQKYKDGTKTNKLVFRFSPEFFEESKKAREEYKTSVHKDAYEKFSSWMRDNQILINPVILFPTKQGDMYHFGDGKNMRSSYSEAMRQAHITELKEALGEKDYELYMERMKENLDRFAFQYSEQKAYIDGLDVNEAVKKEMLHDWELEYSPYYWAEKIMNNRLLQNSNNVYVRNKGFEYVISVPKKYRKDGSLTGYYDTRYEAIQKNETTARLYDIILNTTATLSDMLPAHQRKELGINGIPVLKNSIVELFIRDKGRGMTTELWDRFKQSVTTNEELEYDYRERDPVTGAVKFKAVSHIDTGEQAIKNLTETKLIRYKLENPELFKTSPTNLKQNVKSLERQLYAQFRKQAIDELNSQNSTDLQTTLRAYAMSAIMYAHKAASESILHVMADVANTRGAYVIKDGVVQKKKGTTNEYEVQGTAKKKIEALNYNLEAFFTGRMHKTEGVFKSFGKFYTDKEKERKKEIDNLLESNEERYSKGQISEDMYLRNKQLLQEQRNDLGGYVEGAKLIDSLLKANSLLGLGWNVLSAFNNMAFGYLANSTEAAREVFFDDAALALARKLLTHSVVRNISFNTYQGREALKIRSIFNKIDIMKDASTELYKAQMNSKNFSKIQFLSPYELNKRTEYLNQGQTAIAFLLFNKIKTKNGNEISLYEALDDNGDWNTDLIEEPTMQQFGNLKSQLDQLIKRVHGNYDELSPMQGKERILGRMLFQFKSWAPETFRKYFGAETPDYILGDSYKGRYITIGTILLNPDTRGTLLTSSFKEFFRTYLNVTSFGFIKKFGENNSFAHLSKTDMANMKANIRQAILWLNLVILYHTLKHALPDDDREKENDLLFFVLLYQISRLQTELSMYSDINAVGGFFGNMIPLTGLFKNVTDVFISFAKHSAGDGYMERGAFKDWNRSLKEGLELVPIVAPAMRTYSIMKGDVKKKKTFIEEFIPEE